jgi:predicted acylesterase/phospholipase RssA
MFQIGALAALEHRVDRCVANEFDVDGGLSSGASVAAALAGGREVQRIYRALLDPADDYFPLERRHILMADLGEWKRTLKTAVRALGRGSRSMLSQSLAPTVASTWEELAELYDSLPTGLFSLEGYERFLEDNFARRGVPNHFRGMPKVLRIVAHELDTGEPAIFGEPGLEHVPVTRACAASMAMPPLFAPVRIGDSYYFDPAPAQVSPVELAVELGAELIVVVNPMVPFRVSRVPTGHGESTSLRDKGALWIGNQANRIKMHAQLKSAIERVQASGKARVISVEPEPTDGTLFLHNSVSFGLRRAVLEFSYLYTRELIERRCKNGELDAELLARGGWRAASEAVARDA